MKQFSFSIILIIISLIQYSCSPEQKKVENKKLTTFSGQILNPFTDSVWIENYQYFRPQKKIYAAALDSLGKFEFSIELTQSYTMDFTDGRESTSIFLSPGDKLFLSLNTKQFDESITYKGVGDVNNNYLKERYLRFYDNKIFMIYNLRDSLGVEGGINYLDSLQKLRYQFLNDYNELHPDMDTTFIKWEKTNIEFELPSRLIEYIYGKPYTDTSLNRIFQVYGTYINKKVLDSTTDNYISYLDGYPIFLEQQNDDLLSNSKNRDSITLQLIATNTHGFARNFMLTNKLIYRIEDGDTGYYSKNTHLIENYISNNSFTQLLLNGYQKTCRLLNQDLPDGINMVNLENDTFSDLSFQQIIDKYKGNVIYLDFWASWCGPCLSEMPFSLEIQDHFAGKNVSFIYFSTDRDSNAWERAIKLSAIKGEHYKMNKPIKKTINSIFDVKFIPRYILIDNNGQVVNDRAKRPSNPDLIKDIEALLMDNN